MMKRIVLICFLILFSQWSFAQQKVLRVGVPLNATPISFKSFSGQYRGIAVATWREIALNLGWKYKIIPITSSYEQAIQNLQKGKYDILVGAFSVTHKRMLLVDYTRPFFLNKIGLAVRKKRMNFMEALRNTFDVTLVILVGLLLLGFIAFGFLFWRAEHRYLKPREVSEAPKVKETVWAMMTTFLGHVLYQPKSVGARIVLIFWLMISIIFLAAVSAIVTSTLTVVLTEKYSTVQHVSELHDSLIGVESGSIHEKGIEHLGARAVVFPKLLEALKALSQGKLDGVVDDYFILLSMIKEHSNLKVYMSNVILGNDEYAFVLPEGSKLRRPIDQEITKLQDKGFAGAICREFVPHYKYGCEF